MLILVKHNSSLHCVFHHWANKSLNLAI